MWLLLGVVLYMKRPYFLLVSILLWCRPVLALQVEDLDPLKEWQIKALTLKGNEYVSTSELRAVILTQTRPWYTPWKSYPHFDPVTFETDLKNLVRFYQARGYYEAQVSHDLDVENDHVVVRIFIHEGEP